MRIKASDVARACAGTLVGGDVEAVGIGFDTRTLSAGQAFVAVVGERDGHDHLDDARSNGAPFAIVARGRAIDSLACVEVDDTVAALASLASWCRDRLSCPVVGITGSAGKTSTKNLVTAVLGTALQKVHSAPASLNNDIGVPVTLINAPADADALVLEMGMRGFGEIARLCTFARPTIGLVTNVGDAHGERVGGPEGIARAKAELVRSIGPDGVVVLNSNDPRVAAMATGLPCRVVMVGREPDCDVVWDAGTVEADGRVTFRAEHHGVSVECTPSLPGVHMAANAALALGVAVAVGVDIGTAATGVGRESVESGRMRWCVAPDGSRVLDDSYNANVASMIAALETVASVGNGPCVAVLGRMAEVPDEEESHRRVARRAAELGVTIVALETVLYGTGSFDVDGAVTAVRESGATTVLVKGSRSSRTERVVAALLS
mgnify:FL=1